MPKTRAYTRDELQGLRRADLQRLCKTYDIKGANAKTEVLIDTLANYFTSSAYLSSPRAERPRPRATQTKARAVRPTAGPAVALHAIPRRGARTKQPPAADTAPANASTTQTTIVPLAALPQAETPTIKSATDEAVPPAAMDDAKVSHVDEAPTEEPPLVSSDVSVLRQEIRRLRDVITSWQNEETIRVEHLVETKIQQQLQAVIDRQLTLVEQREASVKRREEELQAAWRQLEAKLQSVTPAAQATLNPSRESSLRPFFPPTSDKGPSDPVSSPQKRRHLGEDSSPQKRARLAYQTGSSPHTPTSTLLPPALDKGADPSSPNNLPPRTPSPMPESSSGIADDHSPGTNEAPAPKFATTPLPPGDPSSPTMDRPDSVTRRNVPNAPLSINPTAGPGFGASRTRLGKASKAHIDLATITDESLETGPASFFVPTRLRKDGGVISPPALSPSPSIGGDNYAFTPIPRNTGPYASSSSTVEPTKQRDEVKTPPRIAPSPRGEYMDVALNGLASTSPSAFATPKSRTMLGTERYRDTRFGDEPFVPWTSPKIGFDSFGPDTPTN